MYMQQLDTHAQHDKEHNKDDDKQQCAPSHAQAIVAEEHP
jgi:hypothetical protein